MHTTGPLPLSTCGFIYMPPTIKTEQWGWSCEQEHWGMNLLRDSWRQKMSPCSAKNLILPSDHCSSQCSLKTNCRLHWISRLPKWSLYPKTRVIISAGNRKRLTNTLLFTQFKPPKEFCMATCKGTQGTPVFVSSAIKSWAEQSKVKHVLYRYWCHLFTRINLDTFFLLFSLTMMPYFNCYKEKEQPEGQNRTTME